MTPSNLAGTVVACLAVLAPLAVASAQSCSEQFVPNSTLADFEDHGDGTVTDRRTGLTWSRCSAGQVWRGGTCIEAASEFDWESAEAYVRGVNDRGDLFYADWRLPNLRELASISEVNCREPRINVQAFPATADGFYWTSSRKLLEGPELGAFALGFGADGMRTSRPSERHHLRLVRRGDRPLPASATPSNLSFRSVP